MGLPWWLMGEEFACSAEDCLPVQETEVPSLDREDPWRMKWQSTPVFLPGKLHGQRSLAGYSLYCCKEPDMTEQLSMHESDSQGHKRGKAKSLNYYLKYGDFQINFTAEVVF